VLLCADHEADFLYWFRELGGSEHAGSADLQDEFHEWFLDGGRAPEGYGGLEHVQHRAGDVPDGDDDANVEAVEDQLEEMEEAEREALDVNLEDLDL